ncbi:MAG: hypothetical protein Q9164_002432 [Protoblastenia rupestris]
MASGKKPEQHGQSDPSTFTGRVKASASGLAHSAFAPPSTTTNILASLPNGDNKGESSSASSSNGNLHQEPSSQQLSNPNGGYRAMTLESFRSEHSRHTAHAHNVQNAFDDFVSPSMGLPTEDRAEFGRHDLGRLPQRGTLEDAALNRHVNLEERTDTLRQAAADESQHGNNDGAAVVALLSDPSFSANEEPGDDWSSPEDDGYHLSGKDRSGAVERSFKDRLQANPLNPVPGFMWLDDFSEPADIVAWDDMLLKYHDEVWGDALPLVQEARQEIKNNAASKDRSLQAHPALRRLAMLLQHLNGSETVR